MPIWKTDIEKNTIQNKSYRRTIYTDKKLQIVLMSLNPGEFVPMEIHKHASQFVRVEQGRGYVMSSGHYKKIYKLRNGSAFVVPQGTKHIIKNTGTRPLKFYTIYSPPQHKPKEYQKRMAL